MSGYATDSTCSRVFSQRIPNTHEAGPHINKGSSVSGKSGKTKSKYKHGFTFKAISYGRAFNLCGKSIKNNNSNNNNCSITMIRIAVVVVVEDVPWPLENFQSFDTVRRGEDESN